MPAKPKKRQHLLRMLHSCKNGEFHGGNHQGKPPEGLSRSISDEGTGRFTEAKHKDLPEKKGMVLYTYLPKENTVSKDGILSTLLTARGFEKYRGRTKKWKKEDVLRVLDSWEKDWQRSKALSALAEPIPATARQDLRDFASDHHLYSFDTKDLIRKDILVHLRETNKGKGTHEVGVDDQAKPIDWQKRKTGCKLLFSGIPHYMVETKDGKIPAELVLDEEKTAAFKPPTDIKLVRGLIADLIRNKPKPVPFMSIVDAARGKAVFRAGEHLPALQEAHLLQSGIKPGKAYSHVSPSSNVISEYGGLYSVDSNARSSGRRRGFLQVITSGLSDLRKGKKEFFGDYGAERNLGTIVPPYARKATAAHNAKVMSEPYRVSVKSDFETVLPTRSLADAKTYAASVLPGLIGGHVRANEPAKVMLTDVTRVNRLAKIRQRHPEFADMIDTVIGRYVSSGKSGKQALRDLAHQYVPHTGRRKDILGFKDPDPATLPRYLRSVVD